MTQIQAKTSPISPPSVKQPGLRQLINMDPILMEYFRQHARMGAEWMLVQELMLDGIRYRAGCGGMDKRERGERGGMEGEEGKGFRAEEGKEGKSKHYNVAYVKHNRFLSPKQKAENLTPKVTEMIPVPSPRPVIYGKPKIRVDNDYGCPYHTCEQQCLMSIPYGGPCQPPTDNKNTRHFEVHVGERGQPGHAGLATNGEMREIKEGGDLARYKSVPNLVSGAGKEDKNVEFDKTKKNGQKTATKLQQTKPKTQRQVQQYGNIVYVNKIIEVQTRMPGQMRVLKSPSAKTAIHTDQYSQNQTYDQLLSPKHISITQTKLKQQPQSKIKQLIERDKKAKAMQKNMKKQQQRIKTLQLMLNAPTKKTQFKSYSPNESMSSDEMSMMDSQIVEKYKRNVVRNRDEGSLAHFGEGGQHEHCSECSCSKTFGELEDSDVANQSSFSEFNH